MEVHSSCYSHLNIRTVWWGEWQGIRVVGPVHSVRNAHFVYARKHIGIYVLYKSVATAYAFHK